MLKKFLSLFLCFAAAFTLTVSAFAQSDSAAVEAASSVPLYLKYYYDQLDANGQAVFTQLREAVIKCQKKIKFGKEFGKLSSEELSKVIELLVYFDPMSFNVDYSKSTYNTSDYTMELGYYYKKETFDKMVAAYDKKVDKILEKLTDDMSTYKKIKTIHDVIINTATYDLDAANNDNIYGTLVKKKAKCDGYAHTFAYVCSKAGIRAISVVGYDYPIENKDVGHAWNKVYYNKQWYNVDLTWDDPVNNIKKNLCYDYFMINDKTMFRDHLEDNLSFKVPKATDNSKAYYPANKKYAEDLSSAKSIIKSSINTAAKNKTPVIRFQCSSESVYKKVQDYLSGQDIYEIIGSAKKNYNKNLVDTAFNYSGNDGQYTVTIILFFKNTSLDSYFLDASAISKDMRDALSQYGIK
ncbi:MAG: hypothetical protein J1E40_01975 [Oscillospiraceae bacterium]|nr:hypothetical protein [Oscillospiraceae bacterium]